MVDMTQDAQINVSLLPIALRFLVRVIGQTAAFELCRLRGGYDLVVPTKFDPQHGLVGIIGVKALLALIDVAGGTTIYVPKSDKVLMQVRHQQVHALDRQGKGANTIAQLTGYTRRQVLNIRNDLAEAEGRVYRQPDLFGLPEVEVFDEPSVPAHDPFGRRKVD